MNEHDPQQDQDFPEVERRLRAFGSAPLFAGVTDRTLARLRATGRRKTSGTRLKLVSAAAIAGFVAGGVGLAAADVLPAPVQGVAHSALDPLGIHVPPGHNRYNDPTVCPGGPYRNHGAYVRAHADDPNAGKSPCGKPVQSVDPARNANGADKKDHDDKNSGHGPPPWAHGRDKTGTQGPASSGTQPATTPPKPSTTSTASSTTTSTVSTATTLPSSTTSTTT
jgi:hypothetical protein